MLTMDPIPPGTVLRSSLYEQAVKNLADANRDYAKVLKDMEKHYQPDKGLWSRFKDTIGRGKSAPTAGAQPAPTPQGGAPTAPGASAATAQPPDVYGAVARAHAGTMAEEGQIANKLKEAAGRLEAHREGDRYSVEFTYYEAWSSGDMDCHTTKKFLGSMGRP